MRQDRQRQTRPDQQQTALKKAIEDYQNIMAEIAARDKKMQELEVGKGSRFPGNSDSCQAMIKAGGVKGLKAKAELQQMRSQH